MKFTITQSDIERNPRLKGQLGKTVDTIHFNPPLKLVPPAQMRVATVKLEPTKDPEYTEPTIEETVGNLGLPVNGVDEFKGKKFTDEIKEEVKKFEEATTEISEIKAEKPAVSKKLVKAAPNTVKKSVKKKKK